MEAQIICELPMIFACSYVNAAFDLPHDMKHTAKVVEAPVRPTSNSVPVGVVPLAESTPAASSLSSASSATPSGPETSTQRGDQPFEGQAEFWNTVFFMSPHASHPHIPWVAIAALLTTLLPSNMPHRSGFLVARL